MSQIKLKYEADVLLSDDILLQINDTIVNYSIDQNFITCEYDLHFGINFINVNSNTSEYLKILDLIIDDNSVRHLLYLAYLTKENKKIDSTWVKHDSGALTIPIGNPLGWWFTLCTKKFPNGSIGNNLYEQFEVFYPESITIPKEYYSTLLQDFFKYDFDFTVISKQEYTNSLHSEIVPYVPIKLDYDESKLFEEFDNKKDLLFNGNYEPSQKKYNSHWKLSMCVTMSKSSQTQLESWKDNYIYNPTDFPQLYKLLEQISSLGDVYIYHCFVGVVDPHTQVDPHKDDISQSDADLGYDVGGLCQLFIPIGWEKGNYYKFGSVGLIDYTQGPIASNNHNYVHGSVNESNNYRYTIGIYCKFTGNNILNGK